MADLCDSWYVGVQPLVLDNNILLLLVRREVLDDGMITLKCIIDCEQRAKYNKTIAILII